MSHMLNYVHMDDFKIEALRDNNHAFDEAIAAAFWSKQDLPVIVF